MLSDKVLNAFETFNGTLTVQHAQTLGIDRETLRKAFKRGDLERPFRGVYQLPDTLVDEMLAYQYQFSKGIYSHETALHLHEYGSFSPHNYYMTFPSNYNTSKVKQHSIIKPTNVKKEFYQLGATTAVTMMGNKVRVYDKERTLLDILANPNSHDFTIQEMLEDYSYDLDKNEMNLKKYAKIMRLEHLLEEVGLIYE